MNRNDILLPFVSQSNKKFLTQCYADDLNLTTRSLATVSQVFSILNDFWKVSGLKVNYDKTQGLIFNKTGNVNTDFLPLPLSNWNQNLKILGIPYGSVRFVQKFWNDIISNVKSSMTHYGSVYSNFDAKSIITKSLILPKLSYAATVLSIPNDIRKSIDISIFRFVIPKGDMRISLNELAQKRAFGGYNVDHVSIHASIFALLPIFKYAQHRINNIPLAREQYFIEYNLGLHLSKLLNIPANNRTPHRFTPMKP